VISKLKTYLLAFIGGIVAWLIFRVNTLQSKNAKLQGKAKQAEATRDHALDVLEQDIDINEQEDLRLAKAVRELNDEGHSTELEDPNDWIWEDDEGER